MSEAISDWLLEDLVKSIIFYFFSRMRRELIFQFTIIQDACHGSYYVQSFNYIRATTSPSELFTWISALFVNTQITYFVFNFDPLFFQFFNSTVKWLLWWSFIALVWWTTPMWHYTRLRSLWFMRFQYVKDWKM